MMRLRAKIAVIALLLVSAAAGTGIGSFIYVRDQQVEEVARLADEIQAGLIQSCEQNGNPLREAVQGMIRGEIEQSHSPLLPRLFPQIPPAELKLLIEEQNERRREILVQIAPVDCEQLYAKEGVEG